MCQGRGRPLAPHGYAKAFANVGQENVSLSKVLVKAPRWGPYLALMTILGSRITVARRGLTDPSWVTGSLSELGHGAEGKSPASAAWTQGRGVGEALPKRKSRSSSQKSGVAAGQTPTAVLQISQGSGLHTCQHGFIPRTERELGMMWP